MVQGLVFICGIRETWYNERKMSERSGIYD